jgi:hypothetical protein
LTSFDEKQQAKVKKAGYAIVIQGLARIIGQKNGCSPSKLNLAHRQLLPLVF